MKKKKADKATAVYAGIIILLILIFIGIFVYGLNKVLSMEGTFPPHEVQEGLTPPPATFDEGVNYLDRVIADAIENEPKMSSSVSFSFDEDSFECENESIKTVAKFIDDDVESKLEEGFEKVERNFGEGFEDVIMMPSLTASDLDPYTYYQCRKCGRLQENEADECDDCGETGTFDKSMPEVYCNYIYYKCPSCGETSNIPLDSCEPCGGTNPYYLCYKDCYEITLIVKNSALEKTFAPLSNEDALALLGDEFKDILDINDYSIDYDGLRVFYKTERLTDKLQYLEYRRDMTVNADVTFTGEYESLGTVTVSFRMTEKNRFTFTWPGLELNTHKMTIKPKSSDNLLATLTCDEPTEYTVTWKTSDENVCAVDDEGYLKAGKEPGKATITASYEFQGVTYTDSCDITVKISVEALSINKRKLSLNVGETFTLITKTDPKDATEQSVLWYTEDESIATVDDYGNVKAVSPGTVTVYALSNDGYYKSSCEVTVK